jgi:hypothetical protein
MGPIQVFLNGNLHCTYLDRPNSIMEVVRDAINAASAILNNNDDAQCCTILITTGSLKPFMVMTLLQA